MKKALLILMTLVIMLGNFMIIPFFVEAESLFLSKKVLDLPLDGQFDLADLVINGAMIKEIKPSNKKVAVEKTIVKGQKLGGCQLKIVSKNNDVTYLDVNVKIAPETVRLNRETITIEQFKTFKLVSFVEPLSSCTTVNFTSSNPEVAKVNKQGVIEALSVGETVISVTTLNGKQATCKVIVKEPSIKMSFNESGELLLGVNETYTRSVNFVNAPENAKATFTSSNEEIVIVDANGKIKGISAGVGYIYASYEDVTISYRVDVINTHLTYPIYNVPMKIGKKFALRVNLNSKDPNMQITYLSENPTIVSVDEEGVLKANSYGNTIVYAYSNDGADVKTFNVNVDEKVVAFGIDVSRWQGALNEHKWQLIKEDGVEFAILRIGSGFNMDKQFINNYHNAKKVGIDVGVYHWVNCTDEETAIKEANQLVAWLKAGNYKLEYPVLMDFETSDQKALSVQQQELLIDTYCQIVQDAGYCVGVYGYANMMKKIDEKIFEKYGPPGYLALAMAHYGAVKAGGVDYQGNIVIWQYTSGGKIKGISSRCDMDLAYFDYPTYVKENHLNGY